MSPHRRVVPTAPSGSRGATLRGRATRHGIRNTRPGSASHDDETAPGAASARHQPFTWRNPDRHLLAPRSWTTRLGGRESVDHDVEMDPRRAAGSGDPLRGVVPGTAGRYVPGGVRRPAAVVLAVGTRRRWAARPGYDRRGLPDGRLLPRGSRRWSAGACSAGRDGDLDPARLVAAPRNCRRRIAAVPDGVVSRTDQAHPDGLRARHSLHRSEQAGYVRDRLRGNRIGSPAYSDASRFVSRCSAFAEASDDHLTDHGSRWTLTGEPACRECLVLTGSAPGRVGL